MSQECKQESGDYDSDNDATDTENMSPNTECDQHMTNDRRYRRHLISLSESECENEYAAKEHVLVSSIGITAWEDVVPNPKYVFPTQKKKKFESNVEGDEDSLISSRSSLPTARNYELDFVNCPAWRIGVEPMTYRYIPNNGRYRAFKLAKRLDTPKAFKKSFSTSKLSTDQHHLHREIQRELRKEFELFISLERQKSSILRQKEAKQRQREQRPLSHSLESKEKFLTKQEFTPKHQNRDKANTNKPNDPPKPPVNLPPMDLQHLTQEQGEYYLEQVSSRLKDLEKDIKTKRIVTRPLEEEGYLNASAILKHSRSEPNSLTSPRDVKKRQIEHLLPNVRRKLPTIQDQGHTTDKTHLLDDHSPLSRCTDVFSNELQVRKLQSVTTNGHVDPPLVETHKQLPRAADEPKPVFRADASISHKTETNKMYETVYSESPEHKIKAAERRSQPKSNGSGHIQLFSQYKLRKASDNPINDIDPETVNIIDNIRSSYSLKDDDEVSLGAHSTTISKENPTNTFIHFVDPRGQNLTPCYEDYAKSQVIRNDSGKTQREIEQLHNAIVAKDYANERKKIGLNPYLNKPRTMNPSAITTATAENAGRGVRLPVTNPAKSSHTALGGNFMPEVMVRRAEFASTNKRII